MKVGGNASATEFFTKVGGGSLLRDSDTKKKYSSRFAALYKEEIDKRVKEDQVRFPLRIYVEGMTNPDDEPAPANEAQEEDDFFSSFDKPASAKPAPKPAVVKPAPSPAPPPVIGRTVTSSMASRTTSSSSIRANSGTSTPITSAPATPNLGPSKHSGLGASKLGAKKGLGAVKSTTTTASAFEEAARKAREEEEKEKERSKEQERKAEEERVKATAAAVASSSPTLPTSKASTSKVASPPKKHERKESEVGMERLGMGVKRLGLGAAAVGAGVAVKKAVDDKDDITYARDKFAGQKGQCTPIVHITRYPLSLIQSSLITHAHLHLCRYLLCPQQSPRTNTSNEATTTRQRLPPPNPASKTSKAPRPSRPISTSGTTPRTLTTLTPALELDTLVVERMGAT